MKRFWAILLTITLVFIGWGCRKRSEIPREPAKLLDERDFIVSKNPGLAPPKQNLMALFIENISEVYKRKASRTEVETLVKKQEDLGRTDPTAAGKLEKAAELTQSRIEMAAFGKACVEFCKSKPATEYTKDALGQFMRRGNESVRRLFVDKAKFDIVPENLTLRALLDKEEYEPVFEVNLGAADNIIAFQSPNGPAPEFQLVALCNQSTTVMKADDFLKQVWKQQLLIVWNQYSQFLRTAPADQRTMEGFKRFVKETAPPSTLARLEKGAIRVIPPTAPGEWIACQTEIHVAPNAHLAIKRTGEVGYLARDYVAAAFK